MIMVYYHSDEHEVPIIDISDELKENIHEGRPQLKRSGGISAHVTGLVTLT